uniref:Uncharacterized protein n=1 Tax=Parascaris univalens TaxID=6257 RepID=A0A914ZL45_PARUN
MQLCTRIEEECYHSASTTAFAKKVISILATSQPILRHSPSACTLLSSCPTNRKSHKLERTVFAVANVDCEVLGQYIILRRNVTTELCKQQSNFSFVYIYMKE